MKWFFNNFVKGLERQGIRNGDVERFDRYRYQSIVRESIQNSIDAKITEEETVIVKFKISTIKKSDIKDLLKIVKHIEECRDYSSNKADKSDFNYLNKMLSEYDQSTDSIEILQISDYNTTGMNPNALDAFVAGRNETYKPDNYSGGSKGIGKTANYCLSFLRTIVLSSVFKNERQQHESNMIGISILSTHEHYDEDKRSKELKYHHGYFCEGDELILPSKSITENVIFQHDNSKTGTTISILGLWKENDRAKQMAKSIMNNFWFAIHEKKLIVEIHEHGKECIIFNKDTLPVLIDEFWDKSNIEPSLSVNPNPRPYYLTYTDSEKHNFYKKHVEGFGEFNLILAKGVNFPGRISFFRRTRMLIYKETFFEKGICGVFFTDDPQTNILLRNMENEFHNEWHSKNYKIEEEKAKTLKQAIYSFVREQIEIFKSQGSTTELSIPELTQIISKKKKVTGKNGDPEEGKDKPGLSKKKRKDPLPPIRREIPFLFHVCIQSYDEARYPIYELRIHSDDNYNDVLFEILVASDRELITKDVFIPLRILKIKSKGIYHDFIGYDQNTFKTDVKAGFNDYIFSLEDKLKHSVVIKFKI